MPERSLEAPIPVQEKPKPVQDRPQNPARRSFLKGLAGLAGLAAIGQIPDTPRNIPAPEAENKEKVFGEPKLTIVDVDPNIPNERLVKQALGEKFILKDQLRAEFGEDYKNKWSEIGQKYPEALMYAFVEKYFTHGKDVSAVTEDIWKRIGLGNKKARLIPLQTILDQQSVKTIKDSEENPGVSVNFDPQKVIDILKDDPNQVVNMSFQVGNVDLYAVTHRQKELLGAPSEEMLLEDDEGNYYPGARSISVENNQKVYLNEKGEKVAPVSPEDYQKRQEQERGVKETLTTSTKIEGAYSKDKAKENLPKLFEVCKAYPDKLFVAAAGNEGEDLREALKQIEKPNNLLLVGQWSVYNVEGSTAELPTHRVHGTDVYVNNSALQVPDGSSFSTPVISAYASSLLSRGLPIEAAIKAIKAASTVRIYHANSEAREILALVLNPDKLTSK